MIGKILVREVVCEKVMTDVASSRQFCTIRGCTSLDRSTDGVDRLAKSFLKFSWSVILPVFQIPVSRIAFAGFTLELQHGGPTGGKRIVAVAVCTSREWGL